MGSRFRAFLSVLLTAGAAPPILSYLTALFCATAVFPVTAISSDTASMVLPVLSCRWGWDQQPWAPGVGRRRRRGAPGHPPRAVHTHRAVAAATTAPAPAAVAWARRAQPLSTDDIQKAKKQRLIAQELQRLQQKRGGVGLPQLQVPAWSPRVVV